MNKDKKTNTIQSILNKPSLGYTDNFSKREMWRVIAMDQNGEFKIKHNSGNEIEIHEISIPYRKWNIQISVSDSRPLKFNVSFSYSQHFVLLLSEEDFFDRIFKKFTKSEIQLGWKEFDRHYLIDSNRSDLVKQIISREIQETLLKFNIYSVSYQSDQQSGKAELLSVIQRDAGNKEMILELIEIFKLLIDNLEKAGIIK